MNSKPVQNLLRVVAFTAVAATSLSGQQPSSTDHYPAFSWETVPTGFHFGKDASLMTAEEEEFVARRASFICLEKGHARKQFPYTEDAIEQQAKRLKQISPEMKVIFYWNTFLDYWMFRAHGQYANHPEWWLRTTSGELDKKAGRIKRYDLSNPELRRWWCEVARQAVVEGNCDGVFMDAFVQVRAHANRRLWGDTKYEAIQRGLASIVKETRAAIGDENLIFYNGIRHAPGLDFENDFVRDTDAVMIEHFGHFRSTSKECMLKDIQGMIRSGKQGKIVVFKGWPGFSSNDKIAMQKPLLEKKRIAARNITFPLAAFLVGAQPHSYFIYNWGYRMGDGCLEWYPELDKRLGAPLSDAKRIGWVLEREFKHAHVWIDLESKKARIDWSKD